MALLLRPAAPVRERREVAAAVTKFALSALLALLLVGVAGAYVLARLGTAEAIADARRVTAVTARGVIEPELAPGIAHSAPAAVRRLDRVVRSRVLDDRVVRVKVWS